MKVIKFIISILCIVMFVLLFTTVSYAVLVDNGDGTVTQIKNDGSTLMWLKDANYADTSGYCLDHLKCNYWGFMYWDQANDWIDYLNTTNHLGYNDWRLPVAYPVNGISYNYNFSNDGSTDYAWNISAPGSAYPGSTGSELAYMFYTELGNLGIRDTSGNSPQPGWGLSNTGPFINFGPDFNYWSGTEYAPDMNNVWVFDLNGGLQYTYGKHDGDGMLAWAVRGETPPIIPEPISAILFITGGTLFAGRNFLQRRGRL